MKPAKVVPTGYVAPIGWRTVTYAESQPQYIPLPVLRLLKPEADVLSRWRPTFRERLAVLFGADIWLNLRTFGRPLQPIILSVGRPDWLGPDRRVLGVEDEETSWPVNG